MHAQQLCLAARRRLTSTGCGLARTMSSKLLNCVVLDTFAASAVSVAARPTVLAPLHVAQHASRAIACSIRSSQVKTHPKLICGADPNVLPGCGTCGLPGLLLGRGLRSSLQGLAPARAEAAAPGLGAAARADWGRKQRSGWLHCRLRHHAAPHLMSCTQQGHWARWREADMQHIVVVSPRLLRAGYTIRRSYCDGLSSGTRYVPCVCPCCDKGSN